MDFPYPNFPSLPLGLTLPMARRMKLHLWKNVKTSTNANG